jgi:hypothetical protein
MASSRTGDENRREGNPQPLRDTAQRTEFMERKAGTNPAQLRGLEDKNTSGRRRSVFLDFPFYRTYQELAADRLCYEATSHANRSRNVALHSFLLGPKVLETEFHADVGLPLLGMVADGSGEAAEKRVAENGARARRAGW